MEDFENSTGGGLVDILFFLLKKPSYFDSLMAGGPETYAVGRWLRFSDPEMRSWYSQQMEYHGWKDLELGHVQICVELGGPSTKVCR